MTTLGGYVWSHRFIVFYKILCFASFHFVDREFLSTIINIWSTIVFEHYVCTFVSLRLPSLSGEHNDSPSLSMSDTTYALDIVGRSSFFLLPSIKLPPILAVL